MNDLKNAFQENSFDHNFLKLKLDNNTRWWSILKMLSSFVSNYEAIVTFYNPDNQSLLENEVTINDMIIIKECIAILS